MSENVTREQLIQEYQPFIERGIQNPFDIFVMDDEESQRISRLDSTYHELLTEAKKSLPTSERIKAEIDESTVFFDAGFTDIDLLDEIARDWLVNELADAQALGDQDLVEIVKAKILEIEQKIKELDPTYELTVWED